MTSPSKDSSSQPSTSLEELLADWQRSPYPSIKVNSYFPIYAELFAHLRGTPCTFIEIGILDGGSLFMWRSWLGDKARIIGIDLNPAAKKWIEHGFEIFIGDQGDPQFWRDTLPKIGQFDVLLDDGGHQSFQQIVTTVEAIKHASRKCLIVVEDTATNFMNDFEAHGSHSFLEYSKDATDVLLGHALDMYQKRFPASRNTSLLEQYRNVHSIQFFNGIIAFKLDPECATKSVLVRNRPPNSASDFRYEGKSSATVDWPSPFTQRDVTVRGQSVGFIKPLIKKLIKK